MSDFQVLLACMYLLLDADSVLLLPFLVSLLLPLRCPPRTGYECTANPLLHGLVRTTPNGTARSVVDDTYVDGPLVLVLVRPTLSHPLAPSTRRVPTLCDSAAALGTAMCWKSGPKEPRLEHTDSRLQVCWAA